MSYEMIDRFLRNNLNSDEDYAKYSAALDAICITPPHPKSLTDKEIESLFMQCGGKWNGDQWVIEDADLHPFVRTIESPELNMLRAISDEYNAWIKHHAAGHSYDDFLAKHVAHKITEGGVA